MFVCVPYCAVSLDVGSLQGDGDAVEEDEHQDHMVKQFVRDHALAPRTASEGMCTRVGYKINQGETARSLTICKGERVCVHVCV